MLSRLNHLSLTRSFTPQLDIDWEAETTDEEYGALYAAWSLFVGTDLDGQWDEATRVRFAKYQQMNLMLFTGLLERHGIASLSRLYDLDSSQPFAEYVGHFIKEETYHYMMFTRAVATIEDSLPEGPRLPAERIDRVLRRLFFWLGLVPGRKLRANLTFSLFRFAERITIFANETARRQIARRESFVPQIWAFHALDEARHLAFDDWVIEQNKLPWLIAWLPAAVITPCCIWMSWVLNTNELRIARQLGLRVRSWQLPGLMRRTQAPFKQRVFGLLFGDRSLGQDDSHPDAADRPKGQHGDTVVENMLDD